VPPETPRPVPRIYTGALGSRRGRRRRRQPPWAVTQTNFEDAGHNRDGPVGQRYQEPNRSSPKLLDETGA
jgi:hypothetical protein